MASFRDSLGDTVTSMPGAFLNAGLNSVGQGKVRLVFRPFHIVPGVVFSPPSVATYT